MYTVFFFYFLGNICITLYFGVFWFSVSISSFMQRLLFCLLQSGRMVVLLPSKCDHKYRLGKFTCFICFMEF